LVARLWQRDHSGVDIEGGRLGRSAAIQIEEEFGIALAQLNSAAGSPATGALPFLH
jgi:hypothetical protein